MGDLMKKLLILLSILLLAGCAAVEPTTRQSTPVTVEVVKRWTEEERVAGMCGLYMMGDIPTTICEPDTYETVYYIKVMYDNNEYTYENEMLYRSGENTLSAYYTKEVGKDSGQVYRTYLEQIGVKGSQ